MIIERNFSAFVVFSGDTVLAALNKITANKSRLVFAVSETGRLQGVLTDGDFRRWLTTTADIDLNKSVAEIINQNCRTARVDDPPAEIEAKLDATITALPLLDQSDRVVGVAFSGPRLCRLGKRAIGEDLPCFMIAEIGNNHNGSLELALRLIDEAVAAGADCAKFQMRDMEALYQNGGASVASTDLGAQYTLDLLARFQLSDDDLFRAFDHAARRGLAPLCTPWDLSSLEKLERYGLLEGYKVASADLTNFELLDAISDTHKPMICSTGMATESEIQESAGRLKTSGSPFILLHCNSTYPAPFKDVNLNYMMRLKDLSGGVVGYSGHERDINVALAAAALGAKVIEKHFTLDRSMEGNDHKVSLLPDEFARMVEGVRQIEEALGSKAPRAMSQGERMNRETLAKSLVAAVDIPAGAVVTDEMVAVRSPGQGLQPNRRKDLVGKKLAAPKAAGDFFYASDLEGGRALRRTFRFLRPWGVPVRYHDLHKLSEGSNLQLVEIHLSYQDMELNFRDFITAPLPVGLVVHAPELFRGDHTVDLCAPDENYRARSVLEIQSVINLTRELAPFFGTERPCIVVNCGGFSNSGHLRRNRRPGLYNLLRASLDQLDAADVEIIPQTMPPFPWHFGGQQFHNLFLMPDEIASFCQEYGMRVCLDTSHSKLTCNHFRISFTDFLNEVGPYTAHMHLADAKGIDGEGIQIGEGDIDWPSFWTTIDSINPNASFIPEIWQGHKDSGAGAWLALERLESTRSE